jgi:hypothetical protein
MIRENIIRAFPLMVIWLTLRSGPKWDYTCSGMEHLIDLKVKV